MAITDDGIGLSDKAKVGPVPSSWTLWLVSSGGGGSTRGTSMAGPSAGDLFAAVINVGLAEMFRYRTDLIAIPGIWLGRR